MNAEEATINPDGSSSYDESSSSPPLNDTFTTDGGTGGGFDSGAGFDGGGDEGFEEPPVMEDLVTSKGGLDPAVYLVLAFAIICGLYYYFVLRNKEKEMEDDFFASIDCDKFDLKLPPEVDEYYKIRAKCEEAGWEPGKGPTTQESTNNPAHPHRVITQALMKRAIADIPQVMKIQRESAGMSKLYARSMCSVKQWRSYQAAEALIAQEIADVKAEADDIEPGWSNGVWQQASQYHAMLKKKHEMELQAAQEKAKQVEAKAAGGGVVNKAGGKPVDDVKAKELAAQKAAEELIREEEKAKNKNKKAFSGVKKGFMESGNKGGKKK